MLHFILEHGLLLFFSAKINLEKLSLLDQELRLFVFSLSLLTRKTREWIISTSSKDDCRSRCNIGHVNHFAFLKNGETQENQTPHYSSSAFRGHKNPGFFWYAKPFVIFSRSVLLTRISTCNLTDKRRWILFVPY